MGRLSIVLVMTLSSVIAWADVSGRVAKIVEKHDKGVAEENRVSHELGRAVKNLAGEVRRMKKVTGDRGAWLTEGSGPRLLVFGESVRVRTPKDEGKGGHAFSDSWLVQGRLHMILKRATRLGREIRQRFPGTTAESVTEEFAEFLEPYEK